MKSKAASFQYRLRVRYSEVDSQGIVFNANYLNYLDVAITEYFRSKRKSFPYTSHFDIKIQWERLERRAGSLF